MMGDTAGARLSADGRWWWDGEGWVAAVSPDGLWTWDGRRWTFAVEEAEGDPGRLVAELDRLAAERFSEAGAVLASRGDEWEPPPGLASQVALARERLARLEAIEEELDYGERPDGPLGSLLGWRGGQRRLLDRERDSLESELGPLLAEIGQAAPQPSLKEADELIDVARRLTAVASDVAAALASVAEAELDLQRRVGEAEADLERVGAERESALAPARQAVDDARARQAARLDAALERLRAVSAHETGALLAKLGDLTLYENVVEWPGGRAPAAGAALVAGRADVLLSSHPELVEALALAGAPHAAELQEAELRGSNQGFLLLTTRLGAWLRPLAEGEEKPAATFATELSAASRAAVRHARARSAKITQARAEAEAAASDTSELEAAEAEYRRLQAEPALERPLRAAEARIEAARGQRAELDAARKRLEGRLAALKTPPEPLSAAS